MNSESIVRHHINPLLKIFDIDRHDAFVDSDCVRMRNREHWGFHLMLRYNEQYQNTLLSVMNYIEEGCFIDLTRDKVVCEFTNYCKMLLNDFMDKNYGVKNFCA